MNKVLIYFLILLSAVYMVSCDLGKNEDPNPEPQIGKCGEVTPYIVMQEKSSVNLELGGYIWAQELENVYRIEVSSLQPIFGFKNGHTASFDVSGLNTGTHSNDEGEDVSMWEIPFTVNRAGIDYDIKVRYICVDNDNPMGSVGYSKDLHYNPGDLCDASDTDQFNHFIYQFPLLNDVEYTDNDPVTMRSFNIRFQTHTPWINGVEGFFDFFNDTEAYYELVNINGGKLTADMQLDWFYDLIYEDGNHVYDKSFLEEQIKLDDLIEGLSEEDIADLRSINFIIKACGKTMYEVTLPLAL